MQKNLKKQGQTATRACDMISQAVYCELPFVTYPKCLCSDHLPRLNSRNFMPDNSPKLFASIHGVDFSGARLAGDNIWIASLALASPCGEKTPREKPREKTPRLVSLNRLSDLAQTNERAVSLSYLVEMISASSASLWGIDFPFALPVEVMDAHARWSDQLQHVRTWRGDAPSLGRWCLSRALARGTTMHIRRATDALVKTPFDCYHYRIIYQTFHGMRDVLDPLASRPHVAVLPFQYAKLPAAQTVVVEACPGSTLKRLRLPHQNYKQPAGGPLTRLRRQTRRRIIEGIRPLVEMSEAQVRLMMRNPGADALDAVLAAVGAVDAWHATDHTAVAAHPRFPLEGFVYA